MGRATAPRAESYGVKDLSLPVKGWGSQGIQNLYAWDKLQLILTYKSLKGLDWMSRRAIKTGGNQPGGGLGCWARMALALGPPSAGEGRMKECVWAHQPIARWGLGGSLCCWLPGAARQLSSLGQLGRGSCLPAHPLTAQWWCFPEGEEDGERYRKTNLKLDLLRN